MTEAGQLIKTTGREQLRFADTCQSFPRSAQKNKFHEFIITKSFNSFKTSLHVRGDKARLFSEGLQEQWSHVSFNDCRKKQLQNIYYSHSSDTLLGTPCMCQGRPRLARLKCHKRVGLCCE